MRAVVAAVAAWAMAVLAMVGLTMVGLTVAAASPAGAADLVSIRAIDTREFPIVRVSALFAGERPDLGAVVVRENGRVVPDIDVVPVAESTRPVGVVLVVDTSGSMAASGKLARAKEAARRFVETKAPTDEVALVAFDNAARIAVNFTADPSLLLGAIEGLQPAGETALWDAIRTASGLFTERGDLLPYLIVLSDGADTVSTTTADQALGAVASTGAGVFPIALTGRGESDVEALRRLADASGGTFAETTDASRLDALYQNVQRVLQNQYEISWTSALGASSGNLDVSLKLGDAIATATTPVNAVGVGQVAQPRTVEIPRTPGPLDSAAGRVAVAVLAAAAAGLFGWLVASSVVRDKTPLSIVDAYTRGQGAAAPVQEDRDLVPDAVRRAVEATARMTGGGGLLDRLEAKLDAADVKVTPQEFVVFYLVGLVALAGVVGVAAGGMLALAAAIVGALGPIAVLNLLSERRRRQFTAQLPDALQLLASSLRAGYSLVQGLEAVANEVEDPMGRELRRAVLETRLGRDMEVALDDTARRMNSPDFDWVVIAIRIQREIGGNLAELLSSVSETMISRERLRREVSALTAEGRLSAIIVGALPFVIGAVLMVMNPAYLAPLFASTIGKAMILGGVGLTCAGFAWMKKVITIDV
ncbi:MAG TPA: type II secretion system F family protein [Acidimicrobiales bacterium]|nr:type II secretion system F family protein [Acidimicrobiales bacterium]